ncbi:Phytochelatin synthase [Kaistia soli DSM 19436]|uniref:glutathione gamma-glutamylcysteinyltransferase n=1 Tax=Kaistia soli DSM 19436 TaxID=1122133 RepID=A0A1M4ZES6_9HYPH|nr:phytochelatin synthase family protein [Kaistia soli]SHF16478.1 Phytochelatin synthase [Kaistia soli DSM 19436]
MSFRRLASRSLIAAMLVGLTGYGFAETLALPPSMVSASSEEGEALLVEAEAREAYFPLVDNFVTQKTQSFCGVASMTMVFNAMALPAPEVPEYKPFRTFTQDNVLDDRTEAVVPRATIERMGMTLDQLGAAIATKPVIAAVHHAGDTNLDAFRSEARAYLADEDRFVIVNYLRKAMGQETGGHISPLAAYDAEQDRFLILDVARYKYPPVWVKAADLFAAMNTPDKDNGNRTRGYVLVAKKND